MECWRGVAEAPPGWGRSVVTVGVFDGVHRGHRRVVARARELARAQELPTVVLTFDPHPSEVLRSGTRPPVLSSLTHKAALLAALGVDVVCVQPFTVALSQLSPEQFVGDVLVAGLHAAAVVVGENFRFGHRAAGDVALLRQLGDRHGFRVDAVGLRTGLPDADEATVSSTAIRELVRRGDVEAAAAALSRPHRVEGVVVPGDRRGRTLGYPTANVRTQEHAAVPADGVYAGWLSRPGHTRLPAAISIGTNPTFAGQEQRVEAYVLPPKEGEPGPWLDLYDEEVALDFLVRLRPTLTFDTVDELTRQMAADVRDARRRLEAAPPR